MYPKSRNQIYLISRGGGDFLRGEFLNFDIFLRVIEAVCITDSLPMQTNNDNLGHTAKPEDRPFVELSLLATALNLVFLFGPLYLQLDIDRSRTRLYNTVPAYPFGFLLQPSLQDDSAKSCHSPVSRVTLLVKMDRRGSSGTSL